MTLLVVSAVLAAAATAWVVWPILAGRGALLVDSLPSGVLDADAGKHVALASLQEVEYDYLAGKLDEADYLAMRNRLSREALDAIRAADRAHGDLSEAADADGRHGCGFPNPTGSRFCAGCGERLA